MKGPPNGENVNDNCKNPRTAGFFAVYKLM